MIDWDLVQKLAHIQCTQPEIATGVGVLVDTLHRHPEFTEVYKKGAEDGRKSLRRLQFESATKGNVVMQIWLGKQYLSQRDNLDQLVNTEIQVRADLGANWMMQSWSSMSAWRTKYTRRRSTSDRLRCLRLTSNLARASKLKERELNDA